MRAPIPLRDDLPVVGQRSIWTQTWSAWFNAVFRALGAWNISLTATLTHDFGSIGAQSQAAQTVTIDGARSGDAVIVRPTTAVNGIITDGTVTADNTVTVRAVNYSASPIDPGSQVYRVIVLQP